MERRCSHRVRVRGRDGRSIRSNANNEWIWNEKKDASNTTENIQFLGGDPGSINQAIGVTEPLECFICYFQKNR